MSARTFAQTGRKIVAIGRNFSEHAKELGNAVPTAPFFFLKPTSSYVLSPGKIEIPQGCVVHHEVELGVVIGKTGRDISAASAADHIAGYALALDLTARNLQDEAKKKGLPWSAAKGFDTFTPVGQFIPAAKIADPHKVRLWIEVAGQIKQNGITDAMIFQIPQLIEHVSSIMTLEEGDLLLTGTPKGVGPVEPGDHVVAGLEYQGEELSRIVFDAVARS
ncbi:Acylpyruvase fahd1, mitochondrial [Coemansia erecta]|uniref:Acylpyruvase fahd1, mitochondrial n=1 Tax=Coemansia erecta TaxID=147472 RepID=A0A9W7Y5Q5_9FUNG|nr:Acylpyruvase fahd1, mitochondrial [Coemansia erecta]